MTELVLKAEERTDLGTSGSRRLLRAGHLPAVIYGQGKETAHLVLDLREFEAALRKSVRVIDVDYAGEVQRTLIRELQFDTYGERIRHVDLLRVVIGETIATEVPLEFFGTPKGVSEESGVLDTPAQRVAVECIPSKIPTALEVDVRALMIGDRITVAEMILPEGVVITDDPGRVVASVVPPALEEEEEEDVLVEGGAEPEVIGRPAEGED